MLCKSVDEVIIVSGMSLVYFYLGILCLLVGIEMFHQILDRGEAGDQMGALVRGLKRDDVRRGHVLAKPSTISMHNHFVAQVWS